MEPPQVSSPRAGPQVLPHLPASTLASSAGSSVSSSPRDGDRAEQRPEQRMKELQQAVARPDVARRVGVLPKKTVNLDKVLDPSKRRIKEDIVRIIVQYLRSEGYSVSAVTLQDEANVRLMEDHAYQSTIKKLKKAILDGDWAEVERLSAKPSFRNQQSFLYAIYRQQYLELIERQEYQKAFTYLQKKLKPLEEHQTYAGEFRDLCYLLTCKSVQDIPGLRWWDGEKGSSREKLIEHFQSLLEFEALETSGAQAHVPDQRLLTLLRQAAAYQIEFSRYRPRASPSLSSLLADYACYVLPNAPKTLLGGHKGNVKCVEFVGEEGNLIASGSSDNTVRLWSSEDGRCTRVLSGHTSRVWSVASSRAGNLLLSASGDATACVYDLKGESTQPKLRLTGHEADVYSVALHPAEAHVATAGYDRAVRLFDIATGKLLKTFAGHTSSVATAVFNPYGNLIISGSKDSTIRFWDVTSGLCVRTFSSYLGEVTSLQANANGSYLLSASKDNSNRLWDLKMGKPIKRFKGHQNTSKNFIRCRYGSLQSVVISGSEDGVVYAWDADAGAVVERLTGHVGPVYSVAWSERQSLLASCGHDCSVRLWTFEERGDETTTPLPPLPPTPAQVHASLANSSTSNLAALVPAAAMAAAAALAAANAAAAPHTPAPHTPVAPPPEAKTSVSVPVQQSAPTPVAPPTAPASSPEAPAPTSRLALQAQAHD